MLFYIIIAVLVIGNILLFLLYRDERQKSFRLMDLYESGKLEEKDIPTGSGSGLMMSRLHYMEKDLKNTQTEISQLLNKTDRAGTRLSRNIEKSVIYTAEISHKTGETNQSTEELYRDVAEGSTAVEEIAASIRSLKDQVKVQNDAIEHTTSAVKDIDASIQNVSSISSERKKDTDVLVEVTREGKGIMHKTEEVIRSVQGQVSSILELITVINKIASQTNLLSMNAAIEAAHAGDAGRGFAVVAQEIRNLAETTSKNAKNISDNLKILVQDIESAGNYSKKSWDAFQQVDTSVQEVAQAFLDINEEMKNVSYKTREVVDSADSLNQIAGQTSISMEEMEIGSAEINQILEKSRDFASNLTHSMDDLKKDTGDLNVMVQKVSEAYMVLDDVFASMTTLLDQKHDDEVRKNFLLKFKISSLILNHLNWVASSRSVIDGIKSKEELKVKDINQCTLGQWLNTDAPGVINNQSKLSQIKENHQETHKAIQDILDSLDDDKEKGEEAFTRLSKAAGLLVQQLMTVGLSDHITWTPAMTVNVDLFDDHHQKLLGLINRLYVYMEEGAGASVLMSTLEELIDYTDYHFSAEEKVFEKYNYPYIAAHKEQHKELLDKASVLRKQLKEGTVVLSHEVLDFLQDWVTNHILKTDKQYGEFLKDKKISEA